MRPLKSRPTRSFGGVEGPPSVKPSYIPKGRTKVLLFCHRVLKGCIMLALTSSSSIPGYAVGKCDFNGDLYLETSEKMLTHQKDPHELLKTAKLKKFSMMFTWWSSVLGSIHCGQNQSSVNFILSLPRSFYYIPNIVKHSPTFLPRLNHGPPGPSETSRYSRWPRCNKRRLENLNEFVIIVNCGVSRPRSSVGENLTVKHHASTSIPNTLIIWNHMYDPQCAT
ncbi:hypothetical protein ABKN59_010956 [Abortiporus biennis]